ncbi:cystatin-B-like [Antennarius striatus]|uniref:cystatin-B-like n=1 Tax=Antennarius striatus TaxID=241820 RepID=UPI0035B08A79
MATTKGTCCGGLSKADEPDGKTHELCNTVKPKAQEMADTTFEAFTPIRHKKQVVSGTNHFIKVHVGKDDYVHLRVYEKLPCHGGDVELTGIQVSKTLDDEIAFF